MWDAFTGAQLNVFNGHIRRVTSVAFSNDGTQIVSGSVDETVRVWDVSTATELKILSGHTSWVNSVAFSNDGAHIVSGSSDKSVRVWNASTGAELKVLNGHTGGVNSVVYSKDGARIVSGSDNTYIQVWDVVDHIYSLWTCTIDNWIVSSSGDHLMWVPRHILLAPPYATLIILCQNSCAYIDFQNCRIGPDWVHSYTPSQYLV